MNGNDSWYFMNPELTPSFGPWDLFHHVPLKRQLDEDIAVSSHQIITIVQTNESETIDRFDKQKE